MNEPRYVLEKWRGYREREEPFGYIIKDSSKGNRTVGGSIVSQCRDGGWEVIRNDSTKRDGSDCEFDYIGYFLEVEDARREALECLRSLREELSRKGGLLANISSINFAGGIETLH